MDLLLPLKKKVNMLEPLFKLVQQESVTEIIDNPAIPNEHNNHAVGLATDSIFNGLQNSLSSGGLKDVLGMFGNNNNVSAKNPVVGGIIENLVGSLSSKFGLDEKTASGIAKSLIPNILGKLVSKTNDPSDSSFDINSIIGTLMGGATSQGSPVEIPGLQNAQGGSVDFGSIVKNLSSGSLDSNQDGSIGLDDLSGLIAKVSGKGNTQTGEKVSGGGVMDMLKGLMN